MLTTAFNKNNIFIALIFVFHLVGLIGFLLKPELFEPISPVNLILSVAFVLLASKTNAWHFYASLISVALIGFIIEVIGVKTHLIFGSYFYGNSFGFQLLGVPLLIGINWAILIYSTAQFCTFNNRFFNILLGSMLMVGLDFFIEQSAAKYHFWFWENNYIPLQNYVAWFLISFLINIAFQNKFRQVPNKVAEYFYLIQLLFFGLLYIIN